VIDSEVGGWVLQPCGLIAMPPGAGGVEILSADVGEGVDVASLAERRVISR
jgi:hypothetical protein